MSERSEFPRRVEPREAQGTDAAPPHRHASRREAVLVTFAAVKSHPHAQRVEALLQARHSLPQKGLSDPGFHDQPADKYPAATLRDR